MRCGRFLALLVIVPACVSTVRNPEVCCETASECAAVGFGNERVFCETGVCVGNLCAETGCDGNEDCEDPALPNCIGGTCQDFTCEQSGGRITYLSRRDGDDDVFVMLATGRNPQRVTDTPDNESGPQWSPDGSTIAYRGVAQGKPDLFVVEVPIAGARTTRALTSDAAAEEHVRWSRDGRRLVFDAAIAGVRHVTVIGADGGGRLMVPGSPDPFADADWSSDGESLIMTAGNPATMFVQTTVADGNTLLSFAAENPSSPRTSPDGRHVYFLAGTPTHIQSAALGPLSVVGLTTGNDPELELEWSPDGSKVAFVRNVGGNHEIFVMNADGTGQRNLTMSTANEDHPRWSPDGAFIVFETDRDGNREIYRMTANGTEVTNLTNDSAADTAPEWGRCPP
ncbi:MAG: PD40 domain-containing protein [Deltaproteobacteria bacterium]|nr:PD40 domain-containing protein [Deltaproteobacteria bacterium]